MKPFVIIAVAIGLLQTSGYAQSQTLNDGVPKSDGVGGFDGAPASDGAAEKAQRDEYDRQAVDLLARADAGDTEAMLQLAAMREQGDLSTGIDLVGADDLFEQAAARGNTYGRQRICIAYLLGEGRPRDVDKGLDTCGPLGNKDPAGLFSAAYDFDNGISGPKDENVAAGLYLKAAKQGSGEAMDAVGRKVLAAGSVKRARDWFVQGTYAGAADAMDDLARLYEKGGDVEADMDEARWLYINAARRGNVHAQTWLKAAPPAAPLPRINLFDANTHNFTGFKVSTDKAGKETRKPYDMASVLRTAYPARAMNFQKAGRAVVQCYVNSRHRMDVCVISKENPLDYTFGWALSAVYEDNILVPDTDSKGWPTAHSVFMLGMNWQLK